MSSISSTNNSIFEKLLQSGDSRLHTFESGKYLYLPSNAPQHVFVLHKGAVKVGSYAPSGKEVMYDCVMPGEFFGDLQLLDDTFFTEFAKALVKAEVVMIPIQSFKKLIRSDNSLNDWFNEIATRRWCRAETRLFRISAEKPLDRILHLLPLLSQTISDADSRRFELLQLLSYQDMADLCGISRQSAARLLKECLAESQS
ncbi:MAG: Crp/Fnr family transcriptional regulator [Cyclobacteriaceae bacterium]